MQLLLAPMEGLLDFALRDTLTRVAAAPMAGAPAPMGAPPAPPPPGCGHAPTAPHPSGIDRCVSEFIRISDTLLPPRAFIRTMPELLTGGRTLAGVPVRGQLLGSDPTLLAENAARLAELGSHGVDLNFGCPAKVVNRHGGGSSLLDDPELVHRIVAAVRRAVPAHLPVSAKMRLGFNDDHRAEDNARAIEAAGASEIVVHARTKAHGYRPPAYWERIADLRREVTLPLVANGEIWTVADALRCQQVSGCTSLMLGRGMVADPGLALAIRAAVAAQVRGVGNAENFKQKVPLPLVLIDLLATNSANHMPKQARLLVEAQRPEQGQVQAQRPVLKQEQEQEHRQNPGLGAVLEGRPGSATAFAGALASVHPPHVPWARLQPLLGSFWALVEQRVERRHRAGRLKQWLNLLRRRYPEAQAAFDALRTTNDADAVARWLASVPLGAGTAPAVEGARWAGGQLAAPPAITRTP